MHQIKEQADTPKQGPGCMQTKSEKEGGLMYANQGTSKREEPGREPECELGLLTMRRVSDDKESKDKEGA